MSGFRASTLAVLAATLLAALGAAAALRLVTYESHEGYFGPAWSPDGRTVYVIRRNANGFTWGPGWEFFTPPAKAFVVSDVLSLCAIDARSGENRVLETIRGGPVAGRVTRNYRNRVFGIFSVSIRPAADTVAYIVTMSLPKVPSGEPWHVRGTWPRSTPAAPAWRMEWHGDASSEPVLMDGRELVVTEGDEAFPAAILVVKADTTYDVLIHNREFAHRYAGGVPSRWIAERSRRGQILREREFTAVHEALTDSLRRLGRSEGEAILGAYDRMKDLGFLPRDPMLVARRVDAAPQRTIVFDIPSSYFRVGLFRDIAAATAAPGDSIDTDTGDYLGYAGDDVGPRLRAYREGHATFFVRVEGTLYRMEVVKP